MSGGGERPFRAHARQPLRLRLVVWHPRAGWQQEAQTSDVALGGARIALSRSLICGDVVIVSFVGSRPAYLGGTIDDAVSRPGAARPDAPSLEARVAWTVPAPNADANAGANADADADADADQVRAGLAFAPRDPYVVLDIFQRIARNRDDD